MEENEKEDKLSLQAEVYCAVQARGYIPEHDRQFPDWQLVNKQVLKSLEEFGEVAREMFDEQYPSEKEIADVIIPLLVISEELGYDIEQAIRAKVNGDVVRGVR